MKRGVIKAFLFLFVLLVWNISLTSAQDFKSKVSLNTIKLPEEVQFRYVDLPQRIMDYIDTYAWSDEELPFTIELKIQIWFEEIYRGYEDTFKARLVMSTNTGRQYADKQWKFKYNKGDDISHYLSEYSSFQSIFDFYLNLIIGDEMDLLGEHLGTPFYSKAENISQQAKFSRYQWWWDKRQQRVQYLLSDEHKPYRSMLAYLSAALYELETGNKIDALQYGMETVRLLSSIISMRSEKEFCADFLSRNYRALNTIASIPGGEGIKEKLILLDKDHADYYKKNK